MAQRYQERLYTVEEYLALEEKSLEKHEYFRGQIYQIPYSSPEHSIITSNTGAALGIALKGKSCVVYNSGIRLWVNSEGLFTYGDVTVVCGKPQYLQGRTNRMLTNPNLIVEILSPSTEAYDRGDKFALYKGLESFQDYLLVDSRKIYVQHYRKLDANTWLEKTYDALEQAVLLENLNISISLADIYDQVEFSGRPWHESENGSRPLNPSQE